MTQCNIDSHQQPSSLASTFGGCHVLAELSGISFERLNDEQFVVRSLSAAMSKGGAVLLGIQSHKFDPCGVTALAMLSESHSSIHTYPEGGKAFVDVFTCGRCSPEIIADEIASALGGQIDSKKMIVRPAHDSSVTEEIAEGITREWKIDEVVVTAHTPYQDLLIGRTAQGLSLFSNGERQSTELSQRIYHEGQIVPAALMTNIIRRVLVIGSGEGVVSQMAVEMGALEVVHVDIDETCVRLCAEHLPYGYSTEDVERALEGHGAVRLLFQDGYEYIINCSKRSETFDIVVMDLPDEQLSEAQQNRLYGTEFLQVIATILSPSGAFISQAGSTTYWRNETLVRSMRRMRSVFQTTVFFEMEEQDWAWVVGTGFHCDDPVGRMVQRLAELQMQPQFIDSLSILKATIPPMSIRRRLEGETH